jgi:hypothetical protein
MLPEICSKCSTKLPIILFPVSFVCKMEANCRNGELRFIILNCRNDELGFIIYNLPRFRTINYELRIIHYELNSSSTRYAHVISTL